METSPRDGMEGDAMTPTYHLERDSTAIYLWRTRGPCVCILPRDPERRGEAEKLATMLLVAANGKEGSRPKRTDERPPQHPGARSRGVVF